MLNIPGIQTARRLNVDSKLLWKKNGKTGDVTFTFNGELNDIDSIIVIDRIGKKK